MRRNKREIKKKEKGEKLSEKWTDGINKQKSTGKIETEEIKFVSYLNFANLFNCD